jgi:hypothetical protein
MRSIDRFGKHVIPHFARARATRRAATDDSDARIDVPAGYTSQNQT